MRLRRRQCLGLPFGVTGLGALAAGPAGCASPPEARQPDAALDLYLLAGQSNMAGRGAVQPQDLEPDARVFALDDAGRWRPAVEPLHADKPALAGVGPGLAFGKAIAAAQPGRRIGLVPCAVGGTPIALWEPGARHADTGRQPLDDTLRRIALAGPAGRWRGLLWHQGESDCNEAAAPAYGPRLATLVARLRTAAGSLTLPAAFGQMGRWPERPWTRWHDAVDSAHRQAAERLRPAVFVSSAGLEHQGDSLHFDAASARELGRRFARALQTLPSMET